MEINKRIFMWVKKGTLLINNDESQKIQSGESVYTKNGFGSISAE
jgi:hypothetical protein